MLSSPARAWAVAVVISAGCAASPCRAGDAKALQAARSFTEHARADALAAKGLRPIELPSEWQDEHRDAGETWTEGDTRFLAGPIVSEAQAETSSYSFAVDGQGGIWWLHERPRVRRVLHERRCSCWSSGVPPRYKQLVYRLPPEFRGHQVIEYDAERVEVDQFNLRSDGSQCAALP
jgi:hypothetical protein